MYLCSRQGFRECHVQHEVACSLEHWCAFDARVPTTLPRAFFAIHQLIFILLTYTSFLPYRRSISQPSNDYWRADANHATVQTPQSLSTSHYMGSQSGNIQDLGALSSPSLILGSEEPDNSSRQDFVHSHSQPSHPSDMGLRYMTLNPSDDVR